MTRAVCYSELIIHRPRLSLLEKISLSLAVLLFLPAADNYYNDVVSKEAVVGKPRSETSALSSA